MLDNSKGVIFFPEGSCPDCHHISLELVSDEHITARVDADGDALEFDRTVTENVYCTRCGFHSPVIIPFFGPLKIGSAIDGYVYPDDNENNTRALFGTKEKTFTGNPMAY